MGQLHLFTELFGAPEKAHNKLGELCNWYLGALTSQDAEGKLSGCEEGTFLVRMRRFAADSGLLAISYVGKKKQIKHINVYKEPNQDLFYTAYNEPVYKNFKELVEDNPNLKKHYEANPSVYKEYIKQFAAARVEQANESSQIVDKSEPPSTKTEISAKPTDSTAANDTDSKTEATEQEEPSEGGDREEKSNKLEPSESGLVFPNLESCKYTFSDLHQPGTEGVKGAVKKAFLQKEENEGTSWKTRFFILSERCKTLYFYKTDNVLFPIFF